MVTPKWVSKRRQFKDSTENIKSLIDKTSKKFSLLLSLSLSANVPKEILLVIFFQGMRECVYFFAELFSISFKICIFIWYSLFLTTDIFSVVVGVPKNGVILKIVEARGATDKC